MKLKPKTKPLLCKWFAWYPVYCENTNNIVWLEFVFRILVARRPSEDGGNFYRYIERK